MTPPSPLTLYLIRHAHAGRSDSSDPNDHLRPLSSKGRAQTEALAHMFSTLGGPLDRLFSSPYTRAAQTAKPLAAHTTRRTVDFLDALTHDDYPALLSALRAALEEHGTWGHGGAPPLTLALVGHEPYLGELAAYLLTGDTAGVTLKLQKGMLVRLEGPLEPGAGVLHTALPPKLIKRLAAAYGNVNGSKHSKRE